MHVPKKCDSSALLAPQVRDGDLAVGITAYLSQGVPPRELPLYVHHRDQAGGRWGSGELLYQYKTFEMVQRSLTHWIGEPGHGPEACGRAILAGLESQDFPSLDWKQEKWATHQFEKYHAESIRELSANLALLGTPDGDARMEEWNRHSPSPCSLEECRREWSEVRERLNNELGRFRGLFPHKGEDLDQETIETRLRRDAQPILRTYALALLHGQEIQASFQDLRAKLQAR
jgi:hypothetical protein